MSEPREPDLVAELMEFDCGPEIRGGRPMMHCSECGQWETVGHESTCLRRRAAEALAAARRGAEPGDGPYRPYADSHPEEQSFYVHDEKDRPVAQVGDLDEAQRVALMLNTVILRARRAESALKVEQDKARRFYRPDGSFEEMESEAAVIKRRIEWAAARVLCEAENEKLRKALGVEQAAHAETRRRGDALLEAAKYGAARAEDWASRFPGSALGGRRAKEQAERLRAAVDSYGDPSNPSSYAAPTSGSTEPEEASPTIPMDLPTKEAVYAYVVERLHHAEAALKVEQGASVALAAWQDAFGTTQLTHALARLESAEKSAKVEQEARQRERGELRERACRAVCRGCRDSEPVDGWHGDDLRYFPCEAVGLRAALGDPDPMGSGDMQPRPPAAESSMIQKDAGAGPQGAET